MFGYKKSPKEKKFEKKLKITMTLLVRNEEDIIRENIIYHSSQGVDNFIVMDNLSTDNTGKIIKELSRNIDVEYIYQFNDDYSQSEWVTEMARRAYSKDNADWVINSDADEFWVSKYGTLREFITRHSESYGILKLKRHNAVLKIKKDKNCTIDAHPIISSVFESNSFNNIGLPLPGKCMHRATGSAWIAQGNHDVEGVAGSILDVDDEAYILHYPYREYEKYKEKILLGGAAYNRNKRISQTIGSTWRAHYNVLQTSSLDEFWNGMRHPSNELLIGLYEGRFFENNNVKSFLQAEKKNEDLRAINEKSIYLLEESKNLIEEFKKAQIKRLTDFPEGIRNKRPLYYNIQYCLSGADRHLQKIDKLVANDNCSRMEKSLSEMRDIFSLFPQNNYLKEYIGDIFCVENKKESELLKSHCDGKSVILHVSCRERSYLAERSVASFNGAEGNYHHIILVGNKTGSKSEFTFGYDGKFMEVPIADNYESLHVKIFHAITLLGLISKPKCIIKIDDNLVLKDISEFSSGILPVINGEASYLGREVGSQLHQSQWHGWHIGKCESEDIEDRGYQYPLPREYAAGGYGYVIGGAGIDACGYMYLAMRQFFLMRAVGLEDAFVGHAMYAKGIDLHDVSSEENILALPGLANTETHDA